jgi:hypothetical protein
MNFDLNINNYNVNELRDMFDLPERYDESMINNKESKIIEKIMNDKNISEETKLKTITFLINAKNILNEHVTENKKDKNEMQLVLKEIKEIKESKDNKKDNDSKGLVKTKLESYDDHMVQIRTPDGLPPDPLFPRGLINPLKKRTISRTITIDSRFRENYYNSPATNFNLQLPMIVENVLTMSLSSIELPTSYYVISNQYQNNFFTITINGESRVIIVSSGNFTSATLVTFINNQLIALGGLFQYVTFAVNISTSFGGSAQTMVGLTDPGNGKSPLPPGVVINDFELNFQADRFGNDDRNTPLPLKLGWIMGFRNGIYEGNINYVSEAIMDISGPRYFYLVVDDFNNNNNNGAFYTAFNSSIMNKNILGRFPLNASLYSVLLQNNLNVVVVKREYFGPVNIHNLKIQLLDEFGRVVDLNYMDFSFSIFLTIAYDI